MRVLHTVEFYYPHVGGAEEVVRQISEGLAARGHEVTVATSVDANRKDRVVNNVRIQDFNIRGNFVKGIRGEAHRYIDFLLHNKYDVILNYAAQTWTTDLTFSLLDKLQCAKVLAPCGYSGLIGLRRFIYRGYFKRLPRYLRLYDAIVYHSSQYIDKAFGDCMGISNYEIIPNGVTIAEFENPCLDFRSEYNINTPFLLLTVGNHYRGKGHDRILQVFCKLRRSDVTLVIIGNRVDGWHHSCWASCKRAARKDKRVVLLENIPRNHVVAAFAAADIFLFGSRVEAFPLVIIEAMASQTPFVSFEVGALRRGNEEFAGGIIVDTIEEMVATVQNLLNDASVRQQLGESGYRRAKESYDWEKIVDRYEALYKRLV